MLILCTARCCVPGEEEGEVLHGAVEVAGEGVLDEEGGEVEGPQHQLLEGAGR